MNISRPCQTLHSKFKHVNSSACLPSLQLFSVITRWPAGPSEASVCVCVFEGKNMQRRNKKGVWVGCGEDTTASCPAAHAAAWADFRPHVSPECDL